MGKQTQSGGKRTKHDVLTEDEMASFELNVLLGRRLSDFKHARRLADKDIRILDWGCGRGRSVLRLRECGYQAFGLEVDPGPVENGRELFERRGLDSRQLLVMLDEVRRFDDGFFDFIFSESVLEHVADIERAAREMWRLTKPGGVGVHAYPGPKKIVEPHYYVPLAHWLPKNRLRRWWIRLFMLMGIGKNARGASLKQRIERADEHFQYSVEKTYYRNAREMRRAFESSGFEVEIGPVGRRNRWLPRFLRRDGFPGNNVLLFTRKPNTASRDRSAENSTPRQKHAA